MTLAAEFPNDNPELHEGAIWVCLEVTGLPIAERRTFAPIVMMEPEPVIVAPEPEPIPEPVILAAPEPRPSGIFVIESFSALEEDDDVEDIVVEELAPLDDLVIEEVVAIVETAVAPEPMVALEPEPAPAPVVTLAPPPPDDAWVIFVQTLVDVAIAHGAVAAAGELPAALDADAIGSAWAGILRGTSEDWDSVGGSMLDEWAADMLARAVGVDATILKRDLRSRGIAAFGLAA